jgi:hypothetical protein
MKYITKSSSHSTFHIGYKEKCIEEKVNTKFLGSQSDNYINWKNHFEEMIHKLSAACYAVKSMVPVSNLNYYVYLTFRGPCIVMYSYSYA